MSKITVHALKRKRSEGQTAPACLTSSQLTWRKFFFLGNLPSIVEQNPAYGPMPRNFISVPKKSSRGYLVLNLNSL